MMTLYFRRPRSAWLGRVFDERMNGHRRLAVDVRTDDEAYVISASVPGLKSEDLKVEVLENVVTLRGEIKKPENGTGEIILRERVYGKFERSLRLPDPLDAKNAEAKIDDGVLMVRIPKAEDARPRVIEVKAR
ncbi:MAG: Hsp20/alpha crystallin family protein [Anaerolineales bacterium]